VERIAALERAQSGVTPQGPQLERLVANYVDDEVLYREALRLGLDRNDEIIRRRLIQKLEFLQHDAAGDINVDDVALRAYYDAHPAKFTEPERVSFTHLYFSPDRGGDAAAQVRARLAHSALAAGDESAAGDTPPVAPGYDALTTTDARQLFGSSAFVDALDTGGTGQWIGPVRSGYGWHLLRIRERLPARAADFNQVRAEVRAEYLRDLTDAARRRQLDDLRVRYRVALAAPAAGGAS
jgi:peptidyl-prolyl cis-trans isomerase C